MRNLVKAEWLKIWNGRAWWILAAFAVLMCAMACAGFVSTADQMPADRTTPEAMTTTLVNSWFMVELVAALIAMIAATREFGNGAINRTVLLGGGRHRVHAAKLIAAALAGTVIAAATGVLAALAPWVFLTGERHPAWTQETTYTLLGVMAVVVAGAVWGSALGMLIRNQVAAISVLLLNTWLVSEGLFKIVPSAGRFTLDKAMSSIYHDPNTELLAVPAACAVLLGWMALAALTGRHQLLRRDLP